MTCPECGSDKITKDVEGTFCKKCGIEIDKAIYTGGSVSKAERMQLTLLPELEFIISPKQELYAFKLGLKNGKLIKGWEKLFGFKINQNHLPAELKSKALELITVAIKKNMPLLLESHNRFAENWKKINSKYFAEVENLLNLNWEKKYKCYICLSSKGGIHNSSKNFIIVNQGWKEHSNYIIAHELFHIIFRKYITRFFKEKYDDFDEEISEVIINFVLLDNPKLNKLFSNIKFSLDIYPEKQKEIAEKILPIWRQGKSFKDFMIDSYKELGIEKTWISY